MWWEVWVILRKGVTLRSPYIERSIEGQTDFVFSSCYSQRNKTGMQFSDSQLKELQRWWYMRRVICLYNHTFVSAAVPLLCCPVWFCKQLCQRQGKERKGCCPSAGSQDARSSAAEEVVWILPALMGQSSQRSLEVACHDLADFSWRLRSTHTTYIPRYSKCSSYFRLMGIVEQSQLSSEEGTCPQS